MPDLSAAKRHARALAAAEAHRRARLRHDLLGLSGRALSELPALSPEVGHALIALLSDLAGVAARSWRRGGEQPLELVSSDDEWLVRLDPRPGTAVVDVGDGRFVHRDLHLTLRPAAGGDLTVLPAEVLPAEVLPGAEATA